MPGIHQASETIWWCPWWPVQEQSDGHADTFTMGKIFDRPVHYDLADLT